MREYALFPGCFISVRIPQFESSTIKVLAELRVKIKRLKDLTCCPDPFSMPMLDLKAWYSIAARNICLAEKIGLDMLTLCNGCNATLFEVNNELKKNEKLRNEVNQFLEKVDRRFEGKIAVKSILRVLYEDIGLPQISMHIKRHLSHINVAVYYGCHIFNELKEYDNPKNPRSLKDLVEVLGAKVVSYPSEMHCCGAFAQNIDRNLSLEVIKETLGDITSAGADCLVVLCPYCFYQYEISQLMLGIKHPVPVLYYPQLLGLSMGFSVQDMGLQFHKIGVSELMDLVHQN